MTAPDPQATRLGVGTTYRDAGVDVEAGRAFVKGIAGLVESTRRAGVVGGIGGFGGVFEPDLSGMERPQLVAGADGVGTKLRVAFAAGRHDTVGIDLVAMCANDVVVTGAEPLFFLDYFATGRLDAGVGEAVVAGVAAGCRQAGCALLGGETAEMPGSYPDGEYDLAGFCVGAVDAERRLDRGRAEAGDALVGVASSGLHSNGFSLVRRVLLDDGGLALDADPGGLGRPLAEELLEPTRIYVRDVLDLVATGADVRGVAHITGGGLLENVPRMLPDGLGAAIDAGAWPEPAVFDLVRRVGGVPEDDMRGTFNLGVGLVLAVPVDQAAAVVDQLGDAWVIGAVAPDPDGAVAFA